MRPPVWATLCRAIAITAMLAVTAVPILAREKIDVITLRNGDKLTGEIKGLDRGKLQVSTDYMSTVYIEWHKIEKITSAQPFELELSSGAKFVGSLTELSQKEKIQIAGAETVVALDKPSVIGITQLQETFWGRTDASVDFGYSFTRANRAKDLNLGSEFTYRSTKFMGSFTYNSYIKGRQDLEDTARHDVGILFQRLYPNRWSAGLLSQFTRNEELDLDLRSLLGGVVGRHLVQTNRMNFFALGGAGYSRERFFEDPGRNGVESIAGVYHQLFVWGDREAEMTTKLIAFPSLSDPGRLRMEFNTSIRWAIFNDFFWGISAFDSFDSRPPTEDTEKNDFGVTTSVGWKY